VKLPPIGKQDQQDQPVQAALTFPGIQIRGSLVGDIEFERGKRWNDAAGHVLAFTEDGNLELFGATGELIWESETKRLNPLRLVLKSDGNLNLCDWRGYPLWSTRTSSNPGASLVLQPDGNLVLYSATGVPLWETGTAGR
jgi:hypothetical protein